MSDDEKYVCLNCVERSSVAVGEIDRLQADIERLRELLGDVLHDMIFDGLDREGKTELRDRVAVEVGDEQENQ